MFLTGLMSGLAAVFAVFAGLLTIVFGISMGTSAP